MKTEKEKAEAYVRSKCPELMELSFGCEVEIDDIAPECEGQRMRVLLTETKDTVNNWFYQLDNKELCFYERNDVAGARLEIIGHPIRLNDWLRVLGTGKQPYPPITFSNKKLHLYWGARLTFNLTTGQPATESDYQAFNQIVGI